MLQVVSKAPKQNKNQTVKQGIETELQYTLGKYSTNKLTHPLEEQGLSKIQDSFDSSSPASASQPSAELTGIMVPLINNHKWKNIKIKLVATTFY